jgi:photosynthetic reaction center H subunit
MSLSSGTGAITGYVDVAQVVLYIFWAFFAGLIYYLQRESKREGFPLEADLPNGKTLVTPGLMGMPSPKTFHPAHGPAVSFPNDIRSGQILKAAPTHGWIGAPLEPTGNPMLDGVGPGAYADRADVPDYTVDGDVKIVPLRVAHGYGVAENDPDPRGMKVTGADGEVGGTVTDLWIDKSEMVFRYLEIAVRTGSTWRQVMLPMNFARVTQGGVKVQSILGKQFALVPGLRQGEQITLLEEEKVMAYYGGGTLYATPDRQEPLV